MSIASNLTEIATNLNSALDEINTKIEAKGGTASETVCGVAAAVENLPSGKASTIMATVPIRNIAVPDNIAVSFYTFQDFSEFTEVEYIESTGSQYINSLFVPNYNTKLVYGYQRSNLNVGSIAGTDVNGNVDASLGASTGTDTGVEYYRLHYLDPITKNVDTDPHDVVFNDDGKLYVDEAEIGSFINRTRYRNSLSLYIFALNSSNNAIVISSAKISYFKIYDNGTLVRDFIPCYHTETGIIGMFDLVNNKFYMNAGTGTFLKGGDINGSI